MGDSVYVEGNKASVGQGQVYQYQNNENQSKESNLTFIDTVDPQSPVAGVCQTMAEAPKDRIYIGGKNTDGMLYEIKKFLDSSRNENMTYNLNYDLDGETCTIDFKYNEDKYNIEIDSTILLDLIKDKYETDPQGLASFIDYILFGYIPISAPHTPTLNELYNCSKANPYYKDIVYTR